ncbi:MAG TPA: hypothetical protein EYP23_04665 [Thermoplasmata archaeon]|nr:hypothetical protein [Thermoplasmata archaeon]
MSGKGCSVVTILDTDATVDEIEAEINVLLGNEDGDDYVVFTYSGHGTRYQGLRFLYYLSGRGLYDARMV